LSRNVSLTPVPARQAPAEAVWNDDGFAPPLAISPAICAPDTALVVEASNGITIQPHYRVIFETVDRAWQSEMVVALQRLNETLEEHARRIAHALHDDAGQLIVSALIVLDDLRDDLPPPAGDRVQKVAELLRRLEERIRHLARELRPTILDDLGLRPALEFLAGGFAGRAGLDVHVDVPVPERLPPVIETAVYRVVQEALTNVVRHAAATYVVVSVRREGDQLHCRIRDNGTGFDVAAVLSAPARGLGLLGICERVAASGGGLRISSAPGEGTELVATIPVSWRLSP
jgi:signal transduction histidine kinase